MIRSSIKVVMGILIICSAAFAQTQLIHFPIKSAIEGQDIRMEAKIEGSQARVIFVRIYYKLPEETSFRYVQMRPDINKWVGAIPAIDVEGERMEYFVNAFLSDQQVLTYPEYNPYNQPEEIQIFPAPKDKTDSRSDAAADHGAVGDAGLLVTKDSESSINSPFLLLSPEPGEKVLKSEVLLAVSLTGGGKETEAGSVQIFLDGKNITAQSQISQFIATWEAPSLSPGQHWFKIVGTSSDGKPIEPLVVNFTVTDESQRRVAGYFRGHAFTDLRNETVNESDNSFNMAGGDFSGRYGALQYSGKFLVSSLEDPNYQPRNRYGFVLKTKLLGVEGGDVYPRMNDLILWGKRVRGLSGYIHLGFFNIDAIMGQTYRSIEGAGSGVGSSMVISRYGTFSQKLIGIRPSIGSGRKFQFGLSLVKIQDDTSSIKYGTLPKDNIVIGPDLKIAFDRGRFTLTASSAISLLTNNIYGGAMTEKDIEDITGKKIDLPIQPQDLEKYFIFNDSTIPIDPTKRTSMAYNIRLTMRYFRNILQLGFKSIAAQYFSLANPWIRKDIEGFYFNDRVRLMNNRLYLNFGYEDFVDSFSEFSPNPALDLKTFNYGISIYPGTAFPNINISLKNRIRNNNIDQLQLTSLSYATVIDTFDNREKSLHRDLAIQMNYDLNTFNLDHSLFFSYMSSDFVDDFNTSRSSSQEFSTDMRMITLATTYNIPLKTTLSFATNSNLSGGGISKFEYNMYDLAAEYALLQNRLTTFAEYRSTKSTSMAIGGQAMNFNRSHVRIGGLLSLGTQHTITLDANLISYSTAVVAGGPSSYTDRILRLRWEKFF